MACLADYSWCMATLGDRVWYALHCLPRDGRGKAPDFKAIEKSAGVSNATVSKIVNGERKEPKARTLTALAKALGVEKAWLEHEVGDAPDLTGELPPRPGAEDVEAWRPSFMVTKRWVERDDYPTRAPVIAALRANGKPEALINAMLAETHLEGDPGAKDPNYWWERIAFYEARIAKYVEPTTIDDSALDRVPGKRRR